MSRKYDEAYCYVPENLFYDGYAERDGIQYARIEGTLHYFVTSNGDVVSMKKEQPIYLKPWHSGYGYPYVRIGKRKVLVHRLVAEAFLPNPDNLPVVRHLDDNPINNCVENLAWGTQKDNMQDMVNHERAYTREVYCYELNKYFYSVHEAARYVGVTPGAVVVACKSVNRVCQGMHFCYADEVDKKLSDERWLTERSNFKPIIAIDGEGNRTKYPSRKAACEALGVSDSGVSNVIAGRIKQTGGWRFEEAAYQ